MGDVVGCINVTVVTFAVVAMVVVVGSALATVLVVVVVDVVVAVDVVGLTLVVQHVESSSLTITWKAEVRL